MNAWAQQYRDPRWQRKRLLQLRAIQIRRVDFAARLCE